MLRHRSTGVEAEASERRSQAENRSVALKRLRLALALEVRMKLPADACPSGLWRSRVRGDRLVVAVSHDDYPALVAEALDWLAGTRAALPAAAAQLGVSGSQLAGLFRKSATAWVALNRLRADAGLRPLS